MYHSGKDYQEVDEMALRLRIDYCHFEKRLDVFGLAKQLNIILIKYSSLNKEQLEILMSKEELKDGFTIFKKKNGEYEFYTFYNDSIGDARIRMTIAHEIKHVVFLEENPTEKQENLADHFARYILAPTCLVMPYINKCQIMELVYDFDISYEAACNAYKAANNRILGNKSDLEDFEKEFIAEFNVKC
jgi:hypothetical protein